MGSLRGFQGFVEPLGGAILLQVFPRGRWAPSGPWLRERQNKAEGQTPKPKRLHKHQNMLEGFAHKYELNNPSGSCSEVVRVDRGVVQVSLGVVRVVR